MNRQLWTSAAVGRRLPPDRGSDVRFVFGSVTEQVIQAGDTPVLAVQR